MSTKTTSFALDPVLLDRLKARLPHGSRSEAVGRMLSDHLDILEAGLTSARARLTQAEAKAILDVQNGTVTQPIMAWITGGGLAIQIADAGPDGLYEKWGIDGPALVEKLAAMSQAETLGLLDWAARFWASVRSDDLQAVDKAVAGFLA